MTRPEVVPIKGRLIDLVDIAPAYFASVIRWRNDPEIRKHFFSRTEWTLEGQERWYESYQSDPSDVTFVILSKFGEAIGMVALYAIDECSHTGEFGRLLIGEEAHRGQGLAREAAETCLGFGIRTLGLREIHLETYEWNAKAIRLYTHLGFVMDRGAPSDDHPDRSSNVIRMVLTCSGAPLPWESV